MTSKQPERGEQFALWSVAFAPLLFAIIGLPLMLSLVEPNPFYGVRTAATLASEEAWYRANSASGVAGVISGFLGFAANLWIVRSSDWPRQRKLALCLAVLAAVTLVIVVTGLAAA